MTKQPDVDNHKLIYHPDRVIEWLKKGDCYPIYIEIGPTNSCNHKCVFCALDFLKNKKIFIKKEVLSFALEDMSNHGVKSIMFAGEGEPLLHKDIGFFTQQAKKYKLDVSITTNGVLFTQNKREQCLPNLSWIRFSVDSGSSENYSKIHGTKTSDFERLTDNIKESVEFRDRNKLKTTIGCQFLTTPQNIKEAGKLAKILRDIGVDNLQIKPYSHHPDSLNDLIVGLKEYNNLERELVSLNSKNFKILFRRTTAKRIEEGINYPNCYGLPFFALIDARGNVIPCNLFYNKEEFAYGNLHNNSFSEIWESEKRKKVLNKINYQGTKKCRRGCRLDPINRYLDRLKNPEPHDNFI